MTTRRSEWTFKAQQRDGSDIVARIVVDGWMGHSEAEAEVRIEIDGETTTRKGRGTVARVLREGPGERLIEAIRKIEFSSLDGDVVGEGRSLTDAMNDYGSEVLKIVVEQRRRAVLVESAKAMQAGELVSVELTKAELRAISIAIANTDSKVFADQLDALRSALPKIERATA